MESEGSRSTAASAAVPARSTDASLKARIALALGATLVCLALLELSARAFEWLSPPDAELHGTARSKRTALPDPIPGAYRIFLYGGSSVYGAPIRELSFATQLEFWLRRLVTERPIQLVNFGMNGRPSAFVLSEIERSFASPPDLAIVMTAHNEFLGWEPDSRFEELREQTGDLLEATALARTLRRTGRRVAHWGPGHIPLRPPLWIVPEDRAGKRYRARVEDYWQNTRAIVERTRAADVPLILATAPANLAEWPPVHRFLHDAEYGRRVAALRERIERAELPAAAGELEALRREHPADAMLHFLEARIAAAEGRYAEAARLFDVARDADPMPWRALGIFNDHLRELARSPGVFLADLDRAFRSHAENGLVGFELVADNCHPTPFGNALVARELLRVMAESGLLLRDLADLPPLEAQWQTFREAALRERPELWLEYLLINAVYVMKWPFYDFAAAEHYLEQARRLAPRDWRVAANLGTAAVLSGRIEQGRRELARAEELLGAPLDADDRGPTPYLREALAILSGELPSFAPVAPVETG